MDHLFKWLVIVRLYNSPFSSEKMFEFEHTNDWDYWSVYGKVLKTFLKDSNWADFQVLEIQSVNKNKRWYNFKITCENG